MTRIDLKNIVEKFIVKISPINHEGYNTSNMELKDNQAALILEVDEDGGVSVNVASGDPDAPAGAICQAIAVKLMQDEAFQAEIMDMIDVDDNDSDK